VAQRRVLAGQGFRPRLRLSTIPTRVNATMAPLSDRLADLASP